jgi:hypothetical protein
MTRRHDKESRKLQPSAFATRSVGRRFRWMTIVGSIAIGLSAITGCTGDDRSSVDEAIEEVEDEATDMKKEIEDEIDDHT